MEVICIENEAFYALVDKVIERLRDKLSLAQEKWVLPDEAMKS